MSRLSVEQTGPGQFYVTGGKEPHWVNLSHMDVPMCDCGDHLWRDRLCKHVRACQGFDSTGTRLQ